MFFKRVNHIKKSESGRSMVEMLGVLAVIGVLSIGALAGFQYAFTKYQANETIDEINKRHTVHVAQLETGNYKTGDELVASEFGDTTALGYPVLSEVLSEEAGLFIISVDMVPARVCKQILRDYAHIPVAVKVNDAAYVADESICGTEEEPLMMFVYSPMEGQALEDEECRPGEIWDSSKEVCIGFCQPGYQWDAGAQECVEGDCAIGSIDFNGECYDCDNGGDFAVTSDETASKCTACNRVPFMLINSSGSSLGAKCFKKCTSGAPARDSFSGSCLPCNSITKDHGITAAECAHCPAREHINPIIGGGIGWCLEPCGPGTVRDMVSMECVAPDCSAVSLPGTTKALCELCGYTWTGWSCDTNEMPPLWP
ncbi:MAG: hypothetical protein LBU87_04520 [Lactobacillales bacterium]|jgi:hypothetical protein|nr:hypothetical protein [Lactobacillales bacterium]